MNAANCITKPKKISALAGIVTLNRGSMTMICCVFTRFQSCYRLADNTRFITKFPTINPLVALDRVAVVSAEIVVSAPVLRGGIAADTVFQD